MFWSLWKWLNELRNIIKWTLKVWLYHLLIRLKHFPWVAVSRFLPKKLPNFSMLQDCALLDVKVIYWNTHILQKWSKDRQLSTLAPSNELENIFWCAKFLILSEEMPYMVYSYVTRIVSWIPKYRDFDKIEDTHFCWFSWSIIVTNNSSFNVNAGCSYNVRSKIFRSRSLPYQILFTVSSFSVIKPWQVAKIQQMSILCHSDGVNRHWNEAEISWPHWSVLQDGSHRASPQSVPLQSGFLWQLDGRKVFDGKAIRWIFSIYFYRPSDAYFII